MGDFLLFLPSHAASPTQNFIVLKPRFFSTYLKPTPCPSFLCLCNSFTEYPRAQGSLRLIMFIVSLIYSVITSLSHSLTRQIFNDYQLSAILCATDEKDKMKRTQTWWLRSSQFRTCIFGRTILYLRGWKLVLGGQNKSYNNFLWASKVQLYLTKSYSFLFNFSRWVFLGITLAPLMLSSWEIQKMHIRSVLQNSGAQMLVIGGHSLTISELRFERWPVWACGLVSAALWVLSVFAPQSICLWELNKNC